MKLKRLTAIAICFGFFFTSASSFTEFRSPDQPDGAALTGRGPQAKTVGNLSGNSEYTNAQQSGQLEPTSIPGSQSITPEPPVTPVPISVTIPISYVVSQALSANERSLVSKQVSGVIDEWLRQRGDTSKYDLWLGPVIADWMEVDFWYLAEDGKPIGMSPVTLFAHRQLGTQWEIIAPWQAAYDAVLNKLPSGLISQETKSRLQVSPSLQQPSGPTVEAGIGGFLFAWTGTKTLTQNAHTGSHLGNELDIADGTNFDILAPKDGVIIRAADDSAYGGDCSGADAATNYMVIGHGRQNSTGMYPFTRCIIIWLSAVYLTI
jgi:murein DD-endopeptidase MepM/ murein hydrolase activator NlpD